MQYPDFYNALASGCPDTWALVILILTLERLVSHLRLIKYIEVSYFQTVVSLFWLKSLLRDASRIMSTVVSVLKYIHW
jgi:hypothetical protein